LPVQTAPQSYHFVGVGGVGMSAIAWVFAMRGHRVSGSDAAESEITRNLRKQGVRVMIGHDAEHLGDAEVCIVSTAIRPTNPERAEAERRGLPIWHRAEALAAIVDASDGIAIAGTHGKTTTTGMAAVALDGAGLDPTVLVGGILPEYGGTAKVGLGTHTVAEADESDGSLVRMHPLWAIVTNIDFDHMENYRGPEHQLETFGQFLGQVRPEGGAIVWHDDPNLAALRTELPCRVWTYSATNERADYGIRDISASPEGTRFAVTSKGGAPLCEVTLQVPGLHNVLNAASVVALSHRLGLDLGAVSQALGRFPGVSRRFQRKGTEGGVTVIDDYAHHPTEIRETLRAARSVHSGRMVVAFQPHRYSRTRDLWREFAEALAEETDVLVLTEIYTAGEEPIEWVSGRMIFDALPEDRPQARAFLPTLPEVVEHLGAIVEPGDWVLTLGAGNIVEAGEALLAALAQRE
jgi:UDP-N-acetylmuramate--alanine ligase